MNLPPEASRLLVVFSASVLFVSVSTHLRSTNINTQCVITSVIMLTVNIYSVLTNSTIPKASRPAVEPPNFLFIGCWGSCTRGKAARTCSKSPNFI
jgi:hypothetical protein